jgi:hypothetical protein
MNRRGTRLTLGVVVVGLAVVLVLAVAHWGTVRDHLEAWRFQLTTETDAIRPDPPYLELCQKRSGYNWSGFKDLLSLLASTSGRLVITSRDAFDRYQAVGMVPARDLTPDFALHLLRSEGCRVLEQRFPRSAYVVIDDQPVGPIAEESL